MFNFIGHFKRIVLITKEIKKQKKFLESDLYYKEVDEIPLFNWWKCSKGDYTYLWKEKQNEVPIFFKSVFANMYYQFDYIELDELRKQVTVNKYINKYLTTKDIKWKRKADTARAEVDLLNSQERSETKLNDLIRFVQEVLKLSYYPDATKMSAGYFFNLYSEAKKIVEKHGNNK